MSLQGESTDLFSSEYLRPLLLEKLVWQDFAKKKTSTYEKTTFQWFKVDYNNTRVFRSCKQKKNLLRKLKDGVRVLTLIRLSILLCSLIFADEVDS